MPDILFWWYLVGWLSIFLRPFAARTQTYILQTLNLLEFFGIMIFGWIAWVIYLSYIIEDSCSRHRIRIPIIWRAK
jgi:hypothetical protein